ncbi:DUF4363 family protein [Clostridium chromiireducens]|uniref:DUF4363 family protein n=1 Tax=Clostridium chromiireducens TaxID=225345 RepID=A0A1V4J0C2_9CLOT|nr:DUF4363 family protein [Clostridium chromiireducens]OPJ65603.1 hypothetical protein CLCHR_05870 [Clostridium chromiireducens]RII34878.1 DUF4363 family protein [Clostridium chromiireducens]
MRKLLIISIPIVALISFVLIMLSGSFLKKFSVKNDSIPESIQLITQDIELENWENANEKIENLSTTWKTFIKRIQFSSERDEINSLDTSIARLRGAIAAKDKSASLIELSEAYEHWEGLGK